MSDDSAERARNAAQVRSQLSEAMAAEERAKQRANEIIDEAMQHADKIVEAARIVADLILDEARTKAADLDFPQNPSLLQ